MKRNASGVRIRAARNMFDPKLTQEDLIALMHTRHNIVFTANGMSRIENGRMELRYKEFDLTAMLDGIRAMLTLRAQKDRRGFFIDRVNISCTP